MKNKILEDMEIFKLSPLKINAKISLFPPKMGGDGTKVMYGFCSKSALYSTIL